ncbi:class I adenylate-forming enzyme family protein [Rhodococcus aetherivorans]|uniref:class I adenylate-forming enzyme family protein n=1 Tax=Rhodococcus aetherivorans TaxID=191292 RepID=UPI00241CB5BB|nr:AMP-binding protein [Rhodococcus aetherivorans]WFS11037.1 AMP-binding protein [Rhodococcus aetherivorans]
MTTTSDMSTHDPSALRAQWYRDGWYSRQTCAEALTAAATRHPDAPVVFAGSDDGRTTSVGDILRDAVAVAAALQGLGVGPGDAVAVQLPNRYECAVAYAATLLTGAILVPVVHIYGPSEVEFILEQSGAEVLVMPDRWRSTDYTERIGRLRGIDTLEHVVIVGDDVPDGALAWSALDRDHDYVLPAADADDVCLLIYTSGTTSAPKGVQHSHNSLLTEQRTAPLVLGAGSDDVQLVSFPPGHVAGVGSVLRPLLHGREVVYMDAWDPRRAVDLIERYAVTSTSGTPFHLTGILDLAATDTELASLREFMVGAATVSRELGERAAAAGITTFRCYGSTEHPTISSGRFDDPPEARLRTDGAPMPGVQIRIVDEHGCDVPTGSDGEVVTRGPDQFVGYRDAALNVSAFTDGWLRTGDVGRLDADGRLTITDRIKDVIIRGGETISSGQIEDVLTAHPAVADGVAVAAPDRRYGEVVAAVVVLAPGAELGLEELRQHFFASGLARQKTPERLVVVDELPRTALGKVRKADLRREHFPA